MKKTISILMVAALAACSTVKKVEEKRPLYEILFQKSQGGAAFQFYETITEPKEFMMIRHDPDLKGKIKDDDIKTANFVILSMGEKNTGGYAIGVEKVVETDSNIIVTVKQTVPKPGDMLTMAMTRPVCLIRVNSKKEIIIE